MASKKETPAARDIRRILESTDGLGLAPVGDGMDLRGVTRVYVDIERLENDATKPTWSRAVRERAALVDELASRLPRLQYVDHLAAADAAIAVCEYQSSAMAVGIEPTTSCRIYRVEPNTKSRLRMLLRVGPFRGGLAGSVRSVVDAFVQAYEKANPLSAQN